MWLNTLNAPTTCCDHCIKERGTTIVQGIPSNLNEKEALGLGSTRVHSGSRVSLLSWLCNWHTWRACCTGSARASSRGFGSGSAGRTRVGEYGQPGQYKIANGFSDAAHSTDYKAEYFKVYSQPIITRYSEVYWRMQEAVALSPEIKQRFEDKVMSDSK
eukprot:3941172-Rhodomonas_salina.1